METERAASAAGPMEKKRGSSHQYGSLERTEWSKDTGEPGEPPTLQWFDVGFVFFNLISIFVPLLWVSLVKLIVCQ